MIRCYLVDDEPLARRALTALLERVPGCEVVGEAAGAVEALKEIRDLDINLVFLDIRMPEMSGTDLVPLLPNGPSVIFTTAHRDHAVEGFELEALDYLVKPISLSRLIKAVDRYRVHLPSPGDYDRIAVRSDRKTVHIRLDDIRYIESIRDYVNIHTSAAPIMTKRSLTDVEEELAPNGFLRIHRSFLVNRSRVTAWSSEEVFVDGKPLPVGRTWRADVLAALEQK